MLSAWSYTPVSAQYIATFGQNKIAYDNFKWKVYTSPHFDVYYYPVERAAAGMEAVDESLATDTAVPSSYTAQDYTDKGWGWWYFSHIELRDEKVVLSTDYLPAGTYVYTYLTRASTTGVFKVIPPTASEFYFPDVGGRGAGSVFTVK